MRRDVGVNVAGAHRGEAVLVGEEVGHRHDNELVGLAGFGVDVLGAVRLVAVGGGKLSAAAVELPAPPVVAGRGHDVRGVGRIDVAPVGPKGEGVIAQRPCKVAVGHHTPLESFLHQDGNDALTEAALCRPESLAVTRAKRLFVDVPVHLDFLAEDLFAHQRCHHVVKPKRRDVHASVASTGGPVSGGDEVVFPTVVVAPLAGLGEAVDVLNQASAVVHTRASLGVVQQALDRVLGPKLVGRLAVVVAKNARQVVQGMGQPIAVGVAS